MAKPYDGGSKYLLEHQGRSLTSFAGLSGVISCKSVQSEMVHALQIPDGLLEVSLRGRKEPLPLLVEFVTYPDSRTAKQLLDDLAMVWLTRGVVPDLLVLVLCPKGNAIVPEAHVVASGGRKARLAGSWQVVRLWERDAEEALASPDVGMIPWSVLMKHEGPTEPFLRRCRDRIDRGVRGEHHTQLLAVTQTFLSLKTHDPKLLELFGGKRVMIESPIVEEYAAERARKERQEAIAEFVLTRLGELSPDALGRLQSIDQHEKLKDLTRFAAVCPSLDEFVARLEVASTPPPKPASSRRKKKS